MFGEKDVQPPRAKSTKRENDSSSLPVGPRGAFCWVLAARGEAGRQGTHTTSHSSQPEPISASIPTRLLHSKPEVKLLQAGSAHAGGVRKEAEAFPRVRILFPV